MNKLVYLAGKMSDLTLEEQTGWRNHLKESLEKDEKFRVLSPCDYYTYQNPAHKSEREILNWGCYCREKSI